MVFALYVYVMLFLCYSLCEEACLVERSGKIIFFKKQVAHISSTYFITALVFSVVCMIGGIFKCFKKC
jgi:hypothetical protein